MENSFVIGVDIGGTNTVYGFIDNHLSNIWLTKQVIYGFLLQIVCICKLY